MGRVKPTYIHRIHDDVYFIYKISKYKSVFFQLVHAGKLFTMNNFSKSYLNLTKKYGLEPMNYMTGDTFEEFLSNLYIRATCNTASKIELPKFILEHLRSRFIKYEKKKEKEDLVNMVIRQMEREKNPIVYTEETKKQIREIYNKLKS